MDHQALENKHAEGCKCSHQQAGLCQVYRQGIKLIEEEAIDKWGEPPWYSTGRVSNEEMEPAHIGQSQEETLMISEDEGYSHRRTS